MQKYINSAFSSRPVMPLVGATVTVTKPSGDLATLYSDNVGTVMENPLTTDAGGNYSFYAADGRYNIRISLTGYADQLLNDVLLFDEPATLAAANGSSLIGFIQAGAGAVSRTAQDKLQEIISANDLGAHSTDEPGFESFDNADVFEAIAVSHPTALVTFTGGVFLTSRTWTVASALRLKGKPGQTRIKLTGAAGKKAVVHLDGNLAPPEDPVVKGALLQDIILDGDGLSADGLLLEKVIASDFVRIQATNVTQAGFHLAWAQACRFVRPMCSKNHEMFTTVPEFGILVDGVAPSSANTFHHPILEKVGTTGFKAPSLVASTIIGGTNEGNGSAGLDFGGAVTAYGVGYNTVFGGDYEVNAYADIVLRYGSAHNTFIGITSGYESGPVQILGSTNNTFLGGQYNGFQLDADSYWNIVRDVTLRTTVFDDLGGDNQAFNVRQLDTNVLVRNDSGKARRFLNAPGAVTIFADCNRDDYIEILQTVAGGGVLNIGAPLNPRDGGTLEITIHNQVGALAVNWDPVFAIGDFVAPAYTYCRTARFRYSKTYERWRITSATNDVLTF